MSTLDASILRDSILRERDCGIVTMDVRAIGALSIDTYVTTFGFTPLADGWRSLDRKNALRILQRVLERDLAYDTPLMEVARARLLAESFLSLFSASARYFTNGSLEPDGSGWDPITKSTFDHGVIAHDDHSIGIIWVQDED
jgi:hypothetical protein